MCMSQALSLYLSPETSPELKMLIWCFADHEHSLEQQCLLIPAYALWFPLCKLYMILRIPYQYLPISQHVCNSSFSVHQGCSFFFCSIVNILWCCTYFSLICMGMFADIGLWIQYLWSLEIFSELLWQEENKITATSEARQSWHPSGEKTDWDTKPRGQVPGQGAGRTKHVNVQQEWASSTHPARGRAKETAQCLPQRGLKAFPKWSWCWHKSTATRRA